MDMRTVLLAGATGVLGRHVARELTARGYRVRRLMRTGAGPGDWLGDLRRAPSVQGAFEGVDAVISCAGASMRLDNWSDRQTFHEVDWLGNRNLLDAAQRHGVGKFVYVSLASGPELRHTAYAEAHERVVDALAASGLPYTVVRPTGLHSFFGEVLKMAARGRAFVVGDGSSRTNPIHEADAARACVEALMSPAPELCAGGPTVYSRGDIASLAFWALGRTPVIHHCPAWALGLAPLLLRVFHPRIAALVEFGVAVSQVDVIAPPFGVVSLEDSLRRMAGGQYGSWDSPPNRSGSSANSKPTTSASGFSRVRTSTSEFFASR